MLTPAGVIGTWFRGLLALAILVGGIGLIGKWYSDLPTTAQITAIPEETNPDPPRRDLVRLTPVQRIASWRPDFDWSTLFLSSGVGLVLWSCGGRLMNPFLWRKSGERPIDKMKGQVHTILRPDGTRIHVETHGPPHAPAIILTHGWGLNSQAWSYVKREWGDRFRLIAWDLPGLGQSTRPANRDFTLEKMAQDLRAVLEFSGSRPAVLIGHSIGGMITLTFCRLFPQLLGHQVSKLVLVHTTYENPLHTMSLSSLMSSLQKPLIEPLLYLQIALSPLVWLMTWLSFWNGSIHSTTARNGFCGTESREQLDFMAAFQPIASPAVLARGALGMLDYDATAVLSSVQIPVMVVGGDCDPITLARASETIQRATAGELQMLKPAKHFGHIEYNREFAQQVAAFCDAPLEAEILEKLAPQITVASR